MLILDIKEARAVPEKEVNSILPSHK